MGIFTLLAPPIIGLIGAKATIVISGVFYMYVRLAGIGLFDNGDNGNMVVMCSPFM